MLAARHDVIAARGCPDRAVSLWTNAGHSGREQLGTGTRLTTSVADIPSPPPRNGTTYPLLALPRLSARPCNAIDAIRLGTTLPRREERHAYGSLLGLHGVARLFSCQPGPGRGFPSQPKWPRTVIGRVESVPCSGGTSTCSRSKPRPSGRTVPVA